MSLKNEMPYIVAIEHGHMHGIVGSLWDVQHHVETLLLTTPKNIYYTL